MMKIKNNFGEFFIKSIRVIIFVLITILIIYYEINPTASLVIGSVLLIVLLFSAFSSIEISDTQIKIEKKRLLKILSQEIKINKNEISSISYSPSKLYPLILILPGTGGIKSSKLSLLKLDEKSYNILIRLSRDEQEFLDNWINIFNKKPSP